MKKFIKTPNSQVIKFNSDNFCLKATILGNGPVAIVIGSHKYYPRTFSTSLTTRLKLFCADTRGFALDDPTHVEADFTLDKIIQDIEVIRKDLKSDKVIIIGHSIHSFMAIEYAQQFPDNLSHLVLIASSPIAGPDIYKASDRYFEESVCPERKAAFANNMQSFMQSNDQSFITRMLAFGPKLWYDHGFDASSFWESVEVNTLGAQIIWSSMFASYDTANALKAVKCPIFLALGRYDFFNPPYLWEEYRNYASDLTIRVFEKSSHTPQFEEQKNFDAELLNWLEQKNGFSNL